MADQNKKTRRWFIENAIKAGVGTSFLESMTAIPLVNTWASDYLINPAYNMLDAHKLIPSALQGGFGLLRMSEVLASTPENHENVSLVHIRVVNHTALNLAFTLGGNYQNKKQEVKNNESVSPIKNQSIASVAIRSELDSLGINRQSKDVYFGGKFRFNEWFSNMMNFGTTDGKTPNSNNRMGIDEKYFNVFNKDKIAVQVFQHLGFEKIKTVHELKNFQIRENISDLNNYVDSKNLIKSPLGITCFMMGENYDSAQGPLTKNAILTKDSTALESQTVKSYADQIKQSVGKSYIHREPVVQENLTYKLDQLVKEKPILREQIIGTINDLQSAIDGFSYAGEVEKQFQTKNLNSGNFQSTLESQGASKEFLAQCLYVANAVSIPGRNGSPVNNFNLFLNMVDIDQNSFDNDLNKLSGASTDKAVKAYTYIEGMRQLAMGLNVLSNKITEGHKLIVVVSSEGGRNCDTRQDSQTSFGMVLGPKTTGWLDDYLYANMNVIDSASPELVGRGNTATNGFSTNAWNMAYDTEEGLRDKNGNKIQSTKPSVGDMMMGVVEFLEERRGVNTRESLSDSEARFIKLKRKT